MTGQEKVKMSMAVEEKIENKEMESTSLVKKTPSDFLKSVLGRQVHVKLNNGVEYHGILACLDGYMVSD